MASWCCAFTWRRGRRVRGEAVTTRCYRYRVVGLQVGTPRRVDCPPTPPVPVPATDQYFRLPAHTGRRLAGALKALSAEERSSQAAVRAAVARTFREQSVRTAVAAGVGGTIGISIMTPDVHQPSLGLACILGRVRPGGAFQVWNAAIVTDDPAIDCGAERVADGRLPGPSR